jgi:hypothetical protein
MPTHCLRRVYKLSNFKFADTLWPTDVRDGGSCKKRLKYKTPVHEPYIEVSAAQLTVQTQLRNRISTSFLQASPEEGTSERQQDFALRGEEKLLLDHLPLVVTGVADVSVPGAS